jgi:hypothetical protein
VAELTTLLLDTNHISDLAKDRAAVGPAACAALSAGEAHLVVTWTHLVELTDPTFAAYDDVRTLLRDVPHVLANPFQEVFEEEIAVACARATNRSRPAPRVFASDARTWGIRGGPTAGDAVDLLDATRNSPEARAGLLRMADWAADASMLKSSAAIVRDPESAIRAAVHRHLQDHRSRYPAYADGLTADEILERIGGRAAFPGYHAWEATMTQRLIDAGQKSTRNDFFDEFLLFVAPYSSVVAVDRRTLHRARLARLTCANRMTRDTASVSALIEGLRDGKLEPVDASR